MPKDIEPSNEGDQEYPLMREAIVQFMTNAILTDKDCPVVVVPFTKKYKELTERWSDYPQIRRGRVKFSLVHSNGNAEII